MNLINKLERRLGPFALPHLTLTLVISQVLAYVLIQLDQRFNQVITLVPALVLQGEIWRLFTVVCDPPDTNALFFALGIYFFYMMGTTLENEWGDFRFNLFLLTGWLATVAVSFCFPLLPVSPTFVGGSIFLAFAFLFPEFTIMLFLVLPVKIKWLARLTWLLYGYEMVTGTWQVRLLIAAALLNFFLFFGDRIWFRIRRGHHSMSWDFKTAGSRMAVRHKCVVCGRTDVSDPDLEFRYCSKCVGSPCYCGEHALNHEHRQA